MPIHKNYKALLERGTKFKAQRDEARRRVRLLETYVRALERLDYAAAQQPQHLRRASRAVAAARRTNPIK